MTNNKLLIITVNVWTGPSRYALNTGVSIPCSKELDCYSYRGDLTTACEKLYNYSRLFTERFPLTGMEIEIVSVSQIEDDYDGMNSEFLLRSGPQPIEGLPVKIEDIE